MRARDPAGFGAGHDARRRPLRQHGFMTMRAEDVQQLLEQACQEHRMPGASAGWLVDGEVHFASYGTTDAGQGLPVTEKTLFGIGSTSKTLVGTAVMALVEQGKVSLDDRVVKHLPDLPVLDEQARDTVTVGQLLDHTSGWVGDAVADTGWGDDALERALPRLLELAPQYTAPGQHFSYNNTAFAVAGHLVATLHGTTFERAVAELVLEPLGMTETCYLPWQIANRPHAVGHIAADAGPRPVAEWITARFLGPAGGAFSSAADVMTYARFHLTGETSGRAPISEETRLLMREQRSFCRSAADGAGISWLLTPYGGEQLIEHGGNLSNLMVSTFSMAPDRGLAVSVMGNSAAGKAVGDVIRNALLGPAVTTAPDFPQPDLAEYVGRYRAGQWDVEVVEVDGRLDFGMRLTTMEIEDEDLRKVFESRRTRAVFIDADRLAPEASPVQAVADFVRDADGRIAFLRSGLRLARRLDA